CGACDGTGWVVPSSLHTHSPLVRTWVLMAGAYTLGSSQMSPSTASAGMVACPTHMTGPATLGLVVAGAVTTAGNMARSLMSALVSSASWSPLTSAMVWVWSTLALAASSSSKSSVKSASV